jgi:hypothetical protein
MVLAVTERSPLRAAAYHEAGFAVAACDYGRPVRRVTIQPDALGIGAAYVRNLTGIDPSAFVTVAGRDLLERMILTSLSGPAAERWFRGLPAKREPAPEDEPLFDLVRRMHDSQAVAEAYVHYLHARVAAWIAMPLTQRSVNMLAAALVAHKTITGSQARSLWHKVRQAGHSLAAVPTPEPIPFPRGKHRSARSASSSP